MLTELWSDLRFRARALVRRDAMERELGDELRFHLERETEKYLAGGMPRADAERAARIAFGGVESAKEAAREARGTALLESLVQDVRYAARGLRARPAFTAGVALTLGLGIGANAAMFGIVDRLLFRPPDYLADPSRVHRIYLAATHEHSEEIESWTRYGQYMDLVRWSHAFSNLSVFAVWRMAVGEGDATRKIQVASVSASYFALFDAQPALGRFFTPSEDRAPQGAPVVVLSWPYWQLEFGGRADVIGRQLHIDRTLCTVIGVTPEGFSGIPDPEGAMPLLYLPLATQLWDFRPIDYRRNYGWGIGMLVARRKPRYSVAAATADLTAAFQRSWTAENEAEPRWAVSVLAARPRAILAPVQPERGPLAGPDSKVATWVAAVALVVLLVACANVANLLLLRALARRRELGLRLALGVGRGRLARQLLTESALLAVLGGAVGLALARWGGGILRALFLPEDAAGGAVLDWRTLGIATLAVVVIAIAIGLLPAMHAIGEDIGGALNAAGRDAGAQRSRLRSTLLLFQATLSVVLLVGAGLFVRSLVNVRGLRLGYDVDSLLVVAESFRSVHLTEEERKALEGRLTEAADRLPWVAGATTVSSVPLWGYDEPHLFVPGIDSVERLGDDFVRIAGNADYFRVAGTRVLRGRAFSPADRGGTPRVAIVSDGMARALWPNGEAIGKCIRVQADTAPCTTVIGIAEDIRVRSLQKPRQFAYYVPAQQLGGANGMLLVRVKENAAQRVETLRHALQREMPGDAYVDVTTFRSIVDPRTRSWRLGAVMFVAFGGLALVLAALGLYSVIAYGVAQRRRELGVRIALGAPAEHVLALVVGGEMRVVVAGVLLGSLIALAAGRRASGLLFQEAPSDPVVYGVVALALFVVAAAAASLPAMAAARTDPNVVLRAE